MTKAEGDDTLHDVIPGYKTIVLVATALPIFMKILVASDLVSRHFSAKRTLKISLWKHSKINVKLEKSKIYSEL